MACNKDQTIPVATSMTTAPQVTMTPVQQVEWTCAAKDTITVSAPDPPAGYSGIPFPNMVQVNSYTWDSCALATGAASPIPYSVTFPNNSKKIYGHIIINRGGVQGGHGKGHDKGHKKA